MRTLENGFFILSRSELHELMKASIPQATKALHMPGFDQNDNPLPYYVDRAHQLLHCGARLYTDEQMAGSLVADEQDGKLICNEGIYQAVADAIRGGVKDIHAVYAPESNTAFPGWYSAAVDLFSRGDTYRVYFSHEGNNQVRIEHLEKWWFG